LFYQGIANVQINQKSTTDPPLFLAMKINQGYLYPRANEEKEIKVLNFMP